MPVYSTDLKFHKAQFEARFQNQRLQNHNVGINSAIECSIGQVFPCCPVWLVEIDIHHTNDVSEARSMHLIFLLLYQNHDRCHLI